MLTCTLVPGSNITPSVAATKGDTTSATGAAEGGAPTEGKKEPELPKKRELPAETPVLFPKLLPPPPTLPPPADALPLRTFLRGIQRPQDYKVDHAAAFGLHMIEDASAVDLLPDPSYLPSEEWKQPPPEDYVIPRPGEGLQLNNGRNAPGHKAYYDRCKELATDNGVAFRTVRRLPTAPGDQSARLGNSYEFFKNLELLSGFWKDTTLEGPEPQMGDGDERPLHQRIHVRSGTGSQTPGEFRDSLLASFVKLVTYDFACNVQRPRVEPRLFLGPSVTAGQHFPYTSPPTSFPTNITFVYRTPNDRASARGGIIEGPILALSSRPGTVFESQLEQTLDLCREVVGLLCTAQQRAREGKEEVVHDEKDPKKWWCFKQRWGGGSGGPIGKEEDRSGVEGNSDEPSSASIKASLDEAAASKAEERANRGPELGGREGLDAIRAALAAGGPLPSLSAGPAEKRRNVRGKGKTMSLYDNYRNVRPPSSTWDRKCRYTAIGKIAAAEYDDVFLVNCLNHHVCISRARVPKTLIDTIEGRQEKISEPLKVWRTKWYDLFVKEERIEAFSALWGMMQWLMRVPDNEKEQPDMNPYGDISVYSAGSGLHDGVNKVAADEQKVAEGEVQAEKMDGVETASSPSVEKMEGVEASS